MQYIDWGNFRNHYDESYTYTKLTFKGSRDASGVILTNSSEIKLLMKALKNNSSYNSGLWYVGNCGFGPELSYNQVTCSCATQYSIRPQIGNTNWGGISGATCSASSQNLIVEVEYNGPTATYTNLQSGGTISSSSSVFCTSSTDPDAFTSTAAANGGSGTFTYQWQKSTDGTNFTNIDGATSLTYNSETITQTTYFRRKATNSLTLYSNVLTLEKFEITSHPSTTDQNLIPSASPTNLSVSVSNISGATYQWYKNASNSNTGGTLIGGATSATFTPPTDTVSKWYYYVEASKGGCSITSNVSGLVNVGNPISVIPQATDPWKPLIKLANFDPNDDQQAVKDTDLVGDATNAMLETQKATYNFSSGASNDEVYYFRARMGASHSRGKLGTYFYLALDKDNDYIADVFVEANVKNNTPYVAFHISDPDAAGTGPSNTGWENSPNNDNIERELSSRDAFIKAYSASTDLDNDETDTWIEFAFTEESLKSFVSDALGASIDGDSMFAIYTFTSTSQTANGDIGGINDKTADLTKTWEELGIIINGSLNEISTNAILTPVINTGTFSTTTPTITGTWGSDKEGTDALTVALNGVTYTSSGSDLSVDGYSWSLTVPSALSAGTSYTVSATTTRGSESKTATGTIYIQDNDATLSALTLSDLTLSPSFSSGTYSYSASASSTLNSTDLVATLNSVSSTLSIDGVVQSSSVSVTNALAFGTNSITITVLAENGVNSNTYQIDILKQIDPIIVVNDNTTREPIAEITGTISAAPAQSGNFNVSLPEAPLSDVVITLVVSDNTEATISPSTLTFTSGNYSTPQTVTLTGIDDTENDSLRDGPQSFTVTGTVTSSDPAYNGVIISPIGFTNLDGDPPGISVELTGPTISESGNSITANFSLLSTLTSNDTQVDLPLTLNDGSEASFSNSSVVTSATISFTNTQTTTSIIIYGVDDSLSDGTQSVTLVTGDPSSTVGTADTGYDALDASDVADLSFSVTDNEFVSDIYTDFGGYWSSGISSISSTKPNNNHDLLGFTFGGTTYSTGVNDGVLTTNSVTFTPGEFRALPINLLPNTYKKSYYVTLGNTLDGSAETVQSPTNNFPAYPSKTKLAEYLTDGVNGLNLGTGFANIPSGSRLEFNINAIENTNIGDGEPDFLVTQIAVPGNSKLDEFWFEDVNGNQVGNKVIINLSLQEVLGVWRTDRFTLDGESESKLIDRDRDIRFKAFELSEFGVTSSNSASIKKLVYILSGASDPAFIAYNVPTVSMPTKLSKSAGSSTYKYNTVLTTPISIQVKDASDNNVTQAGITITAGVQSGTATLSGTLEVETDANGVATFTDLTINGTGDQELKFTAPGLDTVTTTLSFSRITTTMSGFPDFTVNTLQEPFALTPPTTNSTADIIYSSTNTAVATVDASTGSVTVVGAGTTSITASVLQNDYYTVGTITATMTVIKAEPTIIDFTDITKTFGDDDFTLTGTSSSTGAISYTVSDTTVATVSGNTITIVGAGTTSITLTQASDANYNSATATITLTVNKATPSYTVTDVTKTYDDPAFDIDSSMLVSSSTGTLTFTVSNTTVATLTGTNTLNIQGAGSTVITAVQSATSNYESGTTSFTLSVDKNNAVILNNSSSALSDVTLVFSDPSFTKTATSSSTGAFTFTSSDTDVIALSTTATTTTSKTVSHTIAGAGTSIITVSQAADANYNAATVSYTVTVTKANPNLSALSDITKTYGAADDTVVNTLSTTTAIQYNSSNPSVVQIASTEVGSDTQTATLSFTGAGTAIVTATLSETANYESATTSFTVTVNKATPTLSGFVDITKTYGDADFSLVQPTSTSGGGFTYDSSNTATATISGDTVSISHSGDVIITATQAANANYESGTISLTLTINKASQSINVDPLPSTKPLKDFTTIPLTATSSSGNPVSVTLASGSAATLSGTSIFGNSTVSNGATCLTSGPLWFTPTTSGYITQIELNAFGTGETASLAIKSDFCGTPSLLGTSNNITMVDGWNIWTFSSPVQVTANTTYYITSDDASACLGVRWAQSGDDPTIGKVDRDTCTNYNSDVASKITVVNSLNQSGNYELTSIGTTGIITVTFSVDATSRYNAASVSLSMDVVKTAQSISYAPVLPTEVTYSDGLTVPLTALASSGLAVSYNVISGPAILTGNSLTISQTGVVEVEATQVGNAAFNPAPIDTKFITVEPGTVTLSNFSVPMKVDSDPDFTITAPTSTVPGTITYSSSNLSVANMNGSTVEIIAAGTTSITATQLAITNKYNSASITTNFVVAVGDTDGDGVLDPVDLCPNTIAGASVDANGCAPYQKDSDSDGVMDDVDNCVTTANADQADTDGDGVGDVCDNAPNTPNADQADTDGDGTPDAEDDDDDNDGVTDSNDDFPTNPNETTDTDGDGQGDNADNDIDNDGVINTLDNCIYTPNTDQLDTDADGAGDACDSDDDNDGYSDQDEIACGSDPLDASSKPLDTDVDGIADCIDTDDDGDGYEDTNDAFPLDSNEWLDTDADGTGNNADTDDDNDGQSDEEEVFCGTNPLDAKSFSGDIDNDGITNCRDQDNDNDGVLDISDAFPLDPTEWTDTDADGIGNNADEDDDNDGFTDLDELECNSDPLDLEDLPGDLDQDGIPDCKDTDIDGDGCINTQDVFPRDPSECEDTDGDGLGDNMDIDSDNDGVPNSLDAFPLDPNEAYDIDGDGIGDNADTDNNNDGFNDSDLLVSGVLTPNSSGLEATWKIINLDKYPNARVTVYNKNGQEVFSAQGYRNDWRGTYKNSSNPLPAASYYYVVELNTGEEPITGWMYITY
ncbi:thrombospondin type 3 repeat-containing protein [Flavobacteriaceae bacterium LSUCC0859]|nr:thrombospondin type 3 repeat-containing protein [Flavobacteriaceae bacterium LSUCC0859]